MTISHILRSHIGLISNRLSGYLCVFRRCSDRCEERVGGAGGRTDLTSGDKIMRQKEDQGAPLDTWLGGA